MSDEDEKAAAKARVEAALMPLRAGLEALVRATGPTSLGKQLTDKLAARPVYRGGKLDPAPIVARIKHKTAEFDALRRFLWLLDWVRKDVP